MPTIPKGSQDIPAPGRLPAPFFEVQPPREIFSGGTRVPGAAAAVDLVALEALVQEERERARRQADEIVLLDARSKLAKLESDLLIRAQGRKGKDAFGLVDETAAEWAKATKNIASELPYGDQRIRFLAIAQEAEARLQRNIFEHVARESAAWDAQKTDEFAGAERAAAVAAYENPERLEQALKNIAEAYSGYAARNGKPQEWAEAVKRKAWTDAVQGAIYMSLTRRNLALASAYFDKYRALIEPETAVKLSAAIEDRRFQQRVLEATDAILTPSHKTIGEALAMVEKINEPELRLAVEKRVKERWQDIQVAKGEATANAMERAFKILENTGGDLDLVPDDVMAELGQKERRVLEQFAANLRKPVLNQDLRDAAIADFWTKSKEDKAKISPLDLMTKWRPYITPSDFEEMSKAVGAAREAVSRGNDSLYQEIAGPKEAALQELQALGLFPLDEKQATDDDRRRYLAVVRQMDEERAIARRDGKPVPASREHARAIIFRTAITPGGILRAPRKKRVIDITPMDRVVPPPEIRREIEADIRSRGKIPTDELVERLYAARILNEPGLYEDIMDEAK